jgi:hypothetical protein
MMAKGQKRSNREVRKPKKPKEPKAATASLTKTPLASIGSSKKKV